MKKTKFLLSIILAATLVLYSATGLMAQSGPEEPKEMDLSGLTLSEIESLFPMSAEKEAAIVHSSPGVPFVVDGIRYEPEEVSLFNGQRLGFVFDSNGILHAFTSTKDLEQFVSAEFSQAGQPNTTDMESLSSLYGSFWENLGYTGRSLFVAGGIGLASLGSLNNQISSSKVDIGLTAGVLFNGVYYQGDYFYIPGGTKYYLLVKFNDLASSLVVLQ